MKPSASLHIRRTIAVLTVWMVMAACTPWLSGARTTPATGTIPSGGAATQSPSQPASDDTTDPLDRLLSLRSIQCTLVTQRPDGTGLSIDVTIDSSGNMHVLHSLPAIAPDAFPDGFDMKSLPTAYELYLVDGKVYQPDADNPTWMTAPIQEDYVTMLDVELHGPDGPALWLDLLPEGSIHASGQETVGGFAAQKYSVDGQIEGQAISGTIWFEPQTDALVQAELHVPAALLGSPDSSQAGELEITLTAQKAAVPSVTLPEAPTEDAATPTP